MNYDIDFPSANTNESN